MAKTTLNLYYSLVPNTLPETDGYHAAVSHVGTVDAETFFARVAARRPGLEPSTAELVLASVCSAAAEILAERQYRISLGDVTFELAIPGSTDSIDGAMAGPAYVAVRPSAAIRNAAAGITPLYSAGDGEKTEVFSVEDIATRGRNAIVGTTAFRLAGANLSATGDDESLKVLAADGTEAVAEVTEDSETGRFITAHLPVALPPGKGKVVLMTHGKRTPEGELHQCVKSVTILAAEPEPTPEPLDLTAVQTAGVNVGCVNETNLTVLRGTSLPTWDGARDALEVRYDGRSFACHDIEQDPDGYLEFNIPTTVGEVIDHDGPVVEIYARINGREGSINAEWRH